MLVRVALKMYGNVYIGIEKERHDGVYKRYPETLTKATEQGFITDQGVFLNRKDAARHAYECGQVEKLSDCIISERLW